MSLSHTYMKTTQDNDENETHRILSFHIPPLRRDDRDSLLQLRHPGKLLLDTLLELRLHTNAKPTRNWLPRDVRYFMVKVYLLCGSQHLHHNDRAASARIPTTACSILTGNKSSLTTKRTIFKSETSMTSPRVKRSTREESPWLKCGYIPEDTPRLPRPERKLHVKFYCDMRPP